VTSPLDAVASIKVKLGLLVAASVVVAALLVSVAAAAGVPTLLTLPVSVALALAVTQLLAAGMVAPLRRMTEATRLMARGDYSVRVHTDAADEVGALAAAFNRMSADLATVDRERRELIATVSHELRTPLAAMTAVLENLADGVVPADQAHLGSALDQAERLRRLVADLLDLSRLEAGMSRLDPRETPVGALVADCVREVTAAGRSATYDVSVPADLAVAVDPDRLRQLLTNVLDNAARHSPHDRPVRVSAGAEPGGWWLEVTDAGPGVPPEDRERVFERFGADASGGGTGLGLAVARWVAELHGGRLHLVDPGPAGGARLRLELPDPPVVPAPAPSVPAQEAPVSTPTPGAPAGPVAPGPAAASGTSSATDSLTDPTDPTAPAGLDGLFGRFWPEPDPGAGGSGLRTVGAAAAVGLLGGLLMSFTEPGLSWTVVLVAAGVAAVATARRRREPWTVACAGLALLLVLPLTLRDAWWIGALGALVAAAVFLCGVTGARTLQGIVLTGLSWPLSSLRGLPWFGRSVRVAGTSGRAPAVVRTVAWSGLGLAVFGAIFASADALFASWVDGLVPSLSFGHVVARGFVAVAIFGLTLAAAYLALNPSRVELWGDRRPSPLANRFEWLVPVLMVDLVFLGFLAAQATAVFGGHDYVERTTGLTYADYVHQGFGQLTLATVLTLFVVWAAARRAGRGTADRWWLRASLGLLCLLTLVVVGSALYRMHVYQEAYGFTTLRLFVDVFEGWLGFVVLAVAVLGIAGLARWLPRVALVSAAVGLLGLAAVNPDAWVAGRNIDRYEETGRLDLDYLQTLSADAAPVVVERLPEEVSRCVLRLLPLNSLREEVLEDPRAWNLGRARAEDALAGIEVAPRPTTGADPCAPVWARYADDADARVG
jgi:signal transduction histidine kinase